MVVCIVLYSSLLDRIISVWCGSRLGICRAGMLVGYTDFVEVVYGASLAYFTVCLLREYPVGEV